MGSHTKQIIIFPSNDTSTTTSYPIIIQLNNFSKYSVVEMTLKQRSHATQPTNNSAEVIRYFW